jgi:hypothetical protein
VINPTPKITTRIVVAIAKPNRLAPCHFYLLLGPRETSSLSLSRPERGTASIPCRSNRASLHMVRIRIITAAITVYCRDGGDAGDNGYYHQRRYLRDDYQSDRPAIDVHFYRHIEYNGQTDEAYPNATARLREKYRRIGQRRARMFSDKKGAAIHFCRIQAMTITGPDARTQLPFCCALMSQFSSG